MALLTRHHTKERERAMLTGGDFCILNSMPAEPFKLRVLAQQKEDENWRFRRFLKERCELDAAELDEREHRLRGDGGVEEVGGIFAAEAKMRAEGHEHPG
jgi:hypothetical protein